jgi:hypothetical protein
MLFGDAKPFVGVIVRNSRAAVATVRATFGRAS